MRTRKDKGRTEGGLNKTEARFLAHLRGLGHENVVVQGLTLLLSPGCRYTPDFWTENTDGTLTAWEVKGFWRDDARVKLKVAADKYRWLAEFVAVQWNAKAKAWKYESFTGEEDA